LARSVSWDLQSQISILGFPVCNNQVLGFQIQLYPFGILNSEEQNLPVFDKILLPQIPNSIPLELPEMVLGSFAVFTVALLMIGSQALKVVRTNPANVLNRE
jgi:hypothetical protein